MGLNVFEGEKKNVSHKVSLRGVRSTLPLDLLNWVDINK